MKMKRCCKYTEEAFNWHNVFITTFPQSTAEVEITFSRLNNNKNKLSDCPAVSVCTLEAIIKS